MGNMRKESINFRNPQEGRIYSIFGIAPTVMSNSHGTTSGGYNAIKILIDVARRKKNENNSVRKHEERNTKV